MEIINLGRGQGKTLYLIKRCEELNKLGHLSYLVLRNNETVQLVWKYVIENDINIPFPLTYQDFIHRRYCGYNIKNLLIDDVDDLLREISLVNIDSISLNKEDKKTIVMHRNNGKTFFDSLIKNILEKGE